MKITLCGSTKFMQAFYDWNVKLSKLGHSVYSVATSSHGNMIPTPEEKTILDLVHLDKISASDAILVLNENNYIGESTSREILWAAMHGKVIYVLNAPAQEVCDVIGRVIDPVYANLFSIAEAIPRVQGQHSHDHGVCG